MLLHGVCIDLSKIIAPFEPLFFSLLNLGIDIFLIVIRKSLFMSIWTNTISASKPRYNSVLFGFMECLNHI